MPLPGALLEKLGGVISHFKQDFFGLTRTALSAEGAAAFPTQPPSCQPEPSQLDMPVLHVTF